MAWTYATLAIGTKESTSKTITDEDVRMFAQVSTDHNPLHLDEEYAKKTIFGRRIAHGMISAGLISAVLGTKLPGEGTIYMGQELKFKRPVFIGDTVTAWVEVIEKDDAKKRHVLHTWEEKEDGTVVTDGQARDQFDK